MVRVATSDLRPKTTAEQVAFFFFLENHRDEHQRACSLGLAAWAKVCPWELSSLPSAGRWVQLRLSELEGGSLGSLGRGEQCVLALGHQRDGFQGLLLLHCQDILPENQPAG